MANRVKEDEKNERIIRSLLKLPDNRRCINCKSLGPQYVCTNFWTFICTNCSGIHREFTHRVKSVSMAKFTSQEVSALQGGGNASAKEIYLKEWDPERNSLPDSSNVERLRTFIKHVYVDRRYTGEKSSEKPPRAKSGDTEDSSENRKMDSYRGGSRSPQYNDTYERRYTDKPSPGGRSDDRNYRSSYDERRSPGSDSDYGRSPVRTEIVNDWRRDDRFGNGKKSEDGSFKVEVTSPDSQKDLNISSPPVVRPVRDILGENVSPLRVIEPPPKANGGKSADALVHTQRTASSSSLPSSNGNVAEVKVENSLIDFDAVPEPPVTNAVPTAIPSDNWANFDSFAEVKVSQVPSNANLLESVLSDLMVPAPISGHTGASASASGNMSLLPPSNTHIQPAGYVPASHIGSVGPAAPINNSMAFSPGGIPSAASGQTSNSFLDVAGGGQWNPLETHQQFSNPPASNQSPSQPFVVGGASSIQVSRAVTGPLDVMSETLKQPSVVERTTGKRELPEDLFTANYSSFPAPMPGWHAASPHGFASNMQYSAPVPVPTYSLASKSSNPFDFNNEPTPVQPSLFPSMMPLQGALPSVAAPTGLPHNPNSGATQAWMPQQFSHQMTMTSHAPNYASAVTPSPYTGQPVTSNTPPRPYGATGFGYEQNAFSSLAPNQQPGGLYANPASHNSFSSAAGNPFG